MPSDPPEKHGDLLARLARGGMSLAAILAAAFGSAYLIFTFTGDPRELFVNYKTGLLPGVTSVVMLCIVKIIRIHYVYAISMFVVFTIVLVQIFDALLIIQL